MEIFRWCEWTYEKNIYKSQLFLSYLYLFSSSMESQIGISCVNNHFYGIFFILSSKALLFSQIICLKRLAWSIGDGGRLTDKMFS